MIGRGLIAAPDFAKRIKHLQQTGKQLPPMPWPEVLAHVDNLFMQCQRRAGDSSYAVSRVKQWLNQLKRTYIEAGDFFNEIRSIREPGQLKSKLDAAH